jgi:hypothetical protein
MALGMSLALRPCGALAENAALPSPLPSELPCNELTGNWQFIPIPLPERNVTHILVSRTKDRIWVGTPGGVASYDGIIARAPKFIGVEAQQPIHVNSLVETGDGAVIVGTINDSLWQWTGDKIVALYGACPRGSGGCARAEWALARSEDGSIYVASSSFAPNQAEALSALKAAVTEHIVPVQASASFLGFAPAGKLWALTGAGLFMIGGAKADRVADYPVSAKERVAAPSSLAVSTGGKACVGLVWSTTVLCLSDGTWRKSAEVTGDVGGSAVGALAFDDAGSMLVVGVQSITAASDETTELGPLDPAPFGRKHLFGAISLTTQVEGADAVASGGWGGTVFLKRDGKKLFDVGHGGTDVQEQPYIIRQFASQPGLGLLAASDAGLFRWEGSGGLTVRPISSTIRFRRISSGRGLGDLSPISVAPDDPVGVECLLGLTRRKVERAHPSRRRHQSTRHRSRSSTETSGRIRFAHHPEVLVWARTHRVRHHALSGAYSNVGAARLPPLTSISISASAARRNSYIAPTACDRRLGSPLNVRCRLFSRLV